MGLFFSKCISTSLSKIEFFFSKFKKPINIHTSSTTSSSPSSLHDARHQPASISPETPTTAAPQSPPIGPILGKPIVDIASLYDLGQELGSGTFGVTYLGTEKSTGLKYACKSISKRKLETEKLIEDVRREVMILRRLAGQPNIVEFKGAYEDEENVYLVMELCSGGSLEDRIKAKRSLSEKEAAEIMRQIMNVIHVCHSMGVMHRDMKPDNLLMVSGDEDSRLKAIDFGVSTFIQPGEVYKDIEGTRWYYAPELLQETYGKEIDVWSVGVILYFLLSKRYPFFAENEIGTCISILEDQVDLQSYPWPLVSESAKELIERMLIKDPKERITVAETLEHPWLKKNGIASDKTVRIGVLKRLARAFKAFTKNLSEEEIKGVGQILTNEELEASLTKLGSKISEAQIQQLMEAIDVRKNKTINHIGFIKAIMHLCRLADTEKLYKTFQYFDRDKSGYITRDELRQAMAQCGMGGEAAIDDVLEDVDTDKDGKINYEVFAAMMRERIVDFEEQLETN